MKMFCYSPEILKLFKGGLEIGGKDNTKQTNELLLRALLLALPVL